MAKLFYTLEEAAAKLNKTTEEIQKLIEGGQLQEFRDRDQIMLKVDQVDLLDGAEDASFDLADDDEVISLASDSGSAFAIDAPGEQSGVSIFDADDLEEADPSAQTQISDTGASDFGLDPSSSGSGLLDLTREVDDTSLGADLMDDVYSGDTLGDEAVSAPEGGELFESTGTQTNVGAGGQVGAVAMVAERIDGGWSGFASGMFLGAAAALALAMTVVIGSLTGGFVELLKMIGDNPQVWLFGPMGAAVLLGLIGAFIGKKSA
jgi:hypothetical protein